jgi:pyruvate kinase
VFRVNFSHADYADQRKMKIIRDLNDENMDTTAILDLQGPKLRVGV